MLDGVAAVREYIDRMVTGDGKCSGMKVLLLDADPQSNLSQSLGITEEPDINLFIAIPLFH